MEVSWLRETFPLYGIYSYNASYRLGNCQGIGLGGWWGWVDSQKQVTLSHRTIWNIYEPKKC